MSTLYFGPYAEQIGHHEGYTAQIQPDGSLSSARTAAAVGYVAVCACGWQGQTRYSPTDEGADAALAEWHRDHLRPLVAAEHRSWPAWAARVTTRALAVVDHVHAGRYDTAVLVLDRLAEDVAAWARPARALAGGEPMPAGAAGSEVDR